MLIGYYPGGGGNRYYRYLKGDEYSSPGIEYDSILGNQVGRLREKYLVDDLQISVTDGTILLHCVNYNRITEKINNAHDIIIIKSDLKSSLRREWSIRGKYKPMFYPGTQVHNQFKLELYNAIKDPGWPDINLITEYNVLPDNILAEVEENIIKNQKFINPNSVYNFINSAYASIIWHNKVYQQYPIDAGNGKLLDIDTDPGPFAEIMRKELAFHENNVLFNFAWDVYEQYGENAPIINLYKERYSDDQ
jgi:hypothetical protein